MDTTNDREPAAERALARRDAIALLLCGPLVTAVLIVLWVAAGAGYFWPMWPMLGMSIAMLVALWRAYGPEPQPAGATEPPRVPRPR